MTAEEIFAKIEATLYEKYSQWKLLKHKNCEIRGYKRAYLDVKKIHRKFLKQKEGQ